MPYKLRIIPSNGDEYDYILEADNLIIGRSKQVDLVIPDKAVSRCHTRLYVEGSRLYVEDLQSANGTLLNGRALNEPKETGPGDVLQISGNVITIHRVDEPSLNEKMATNELGESTLFRDASEMIHHELDEQADDFQLGRYTARLRVLNDLHARLGLQMTREQIIQLVLDAAFEHLSPEEGTIWAFDTDRNLNIEAQRAVPSMRESFLYSQRLIDEVTRKGKAALVLDARSDVRFQSSVSIVSAGVRSLIAAPILDGEGIMGMIALNSRSGLRFFSEEDLAYLVSLASVAALKIRNVAATLQLQELNRTLEQKVRERTAELADANDELQKKNNTLERTRDQLVSQEKMASFGILTAGIAHELKNPLNFVNNFAGVAQDYLEELQTLLKHPEKPLEPEAQVEVRDLLVDLVGTAGMIRNHGKRADEIVARMMSFAPNEQATVSEISLNQVVHEFTAIAARTAGGTVELVFELDEDAGDIVAATQDLGRAVLHLANNGFDAIKARAEQEGDDYSGRMVVRTVRTDAEKLVEIVDNGEGIPEANRKKVFTPFFTTRPVDSKNIGLGLSIAYDTIIKIGASLTMHSQPGEGSIFTISFPLDN